MKNILFLFFVASSLFAQNKDFNKKLNTLLDHKILNRSIVALEFYDLSNRKNIFSQNEKLLLHPASTLKLFTSAASILFLDTSYNFKTEFYFDGNIQDSILFGDLIVKGFGDPLYKSEDIDLFISKLNQKGIKQITGNILGDITFYDSLYWGKGWMWDDNPGSYVPFLTPLMLNGSSASIEIRPGIIGEPPLINVLNNSEFFSVTNDCLTTSEDTSDYELQRDWMHQLNDISVIGDISYKKDIDTISINLSNPETYFLYNLRERLIEEEIKVEGYLDTVKLNGGEELFYTHYTPIKKVLKEVNSESNNMAAESLLRTMAAKYYGTPAKDKEGLKLIDSLITVIGHNSKDYNFVDGSGLSHYNLVTSELVTDLLKHMYKSDHHDLFYNSLAINGITGTLEKRMRKRSLNGKVYAKTGTLSGINTLAGYITTNKNNLIAFSILIQNHNQKSKEINYIINRICELLIKQK